MRVAFLLLAAASTASIARTALADPPPDDAVIASASVGAGAQATATYGALDATLTAFIPHARIGLGARAVWDDGRFRRSDWSRAADVITVIRDVEASYGPLALAAGRLAPAHVAHLADGYRATLDDRWRTGARLALATSTLTAGAEIDDALDPALIAAHTRYQLAPAWAIHAAFAADPTHAIAPTATTTTMRGATTHITALELGAAHTTRTDAAQLDVGAALAIDAGPAALAFSSATLEHDDARFTLRADVRAGETASPFGPLYRIERTRPLTGHTGLGAGLTLAAAAPAATVELQLRERPGLGGLAALSAAAPLGRMLQAAAWAAASRRDAAGAAELRVAWAPSLFSALQVARFYRFDDAMTAGATGATGESLTGAPQAVWSLTAWFGATTE